MHWLTKAKLNCLILNPSAIVYFVTPPVKEVAVSDTEYRLAAAAVRLVTTFLILQRNNLFMSVSFL